MDWLARWRALAVSASCLLHLGLLAGLVCGERWLIRAADAPLVRPVELVAAESEPEPIEKPRPATPRRQPVRLPRPIEAPLPSTAEFPREPAPPPSPVVAAPPEPMPPPPAEAVVAPAPVVAAAPVVADAALPSDRPGPPVPPAAAPGSPFVSSPPAAAGPREGASIASSAPSQVAAVPGASRAAEPAGSITRHARPQGGYQVRPSYPSAARRLGIQGTTLLKVHVLVDGRVGEVVVEETAGHPDLDQAAADAVRRWRFEPARRGDDPVPMWVMLPVEFRLR